MKKLHVYILMFCSISLNAQWINIEGGGLYIYNTTSLTLSETSLNNNGEFIAEETSNLILTSQSNSVEITGNNNITTHNLILDAECFVSTNALVNGDITMESGITDITNSNINLNGNIVNEREESRITSTETGEITKTVDISANELIVPGNLGVSITAGDSYTNMEIIRGHLPQLKETDESIQRYFRFGLPLILNDISFNYFDAELNSLNEEELTVWGSNSGAWEQTSIPDKNLSANSFTATLNATYDRLTLFSEELNSGASIPTAFSPNNDQINDVFVLGDLDNSNQYSMKIYNRWGNLVFTDNNYKNNWNGNGNRKISLGEKLPSGSYFYVLKTINTGKELIGYVYLKR